MNQASPPLLFKHRRNRAEELRAVPPRFGVEIDIRSSGGDLILQHDPFLEGERLADWLGDYRHAGLILNVKEEGLEQACLELMHAQGIAEFFFLDQSFPFLLKTARGGEARCAARISEYESIETVLALTGLVRWVWIDTFSRLPLNGAQAARLRDAGMRLCLVSPELVGRDGPEPLAEIAAEIRSEGIVLDGVCTKLPEAWEDLAL